MNKKQRAKNKRLTLSPMLPKSYSAKQRAEIREREKQIIKGTK